MLSFQTFPIDLKIRESCIAKIVILNKTYYSCHFIEFDCERDLCTELVDMRYLDFVHDILII